MSAEKSFFQKETEILTKFESFLKNQAVAFLCPANYHYPVTFYAVTKAGGICTPLCTSHPEAELSYVIKDSKAEILISHPKFDALVSSILKKNPKLKHITLQDDDIHSTRSEEEKKRDPIKVSSQYIGTEGAMLLKKISLFFNFRKACSKNIFLEKYLHFRNDWASKVKFSVI